MINISTLKVISAIAIITMFMLLSIKAAAANNDVDIDKNSLSYTSAKISILPLLHLSPHYKKWKGNIIFVHSPKVGGTNILYVVDALPTIHSTRFSVPRVPGVSPKLITEGWIGGLSNLKTACHGLEKQNKCSEYKFISGHFPYGADKYLNNEYKYITLIREPIERELSAVNFDYQSGYVVDKKTALKMLFSTMIDNPQTRLIAGESYMSGKCNGDTLEVAKKNLARDYILVGVTEDTNTFTQALITILGNEPVAIGKAQVTQDKVVIDLSGKERKALLRKHKYDAELYKYAKELWEGWKKANIIGNVPIQYDQKILTIMPNFAATHQAVYMTPPEIAKYNSSYTDDEIIMIKQNHNNVDHVNK